MKLIKKILKFAAFVGALAGVVSVIIRALKLSEKVAGSTEKAVFGGKKIVYENEPFESETVSSIFSGISLDFKNATMLNKESTLNILGRFSGVDVKVPEHWHIKMEGTEKNAGLAKKFVDNSENEEAPVLNINYDLKYSGLSVSNPKVEDDSDEVEKEIIEEVIEDLNEERVEENEAFEMSEETKKVIEDFEETFDSEKPANADEIIEEVIENEDTF